MTKKNIEFPVFWRKPEVGVFVKSKLFGVYLDSISYIVSCQSKNNPHWRKSVAFSKKV